jgi:ADP-heptose:LPS heptosyltransferase
VVDLEVYSRLTTVFSILTGARNRVGFYLVTAFWRRGLHTHLVFFNQFSGAYRFYDKVAELFGATPAEAADCRRHLENQLSAAVPDAPLPRNSPDQHTLCIGHACSDMGRERMLSPAEWSNVVEARIRPDASTRIIILGGPADHADAQAILAVIAETHPQIELVNACGSLSLAESVSVLSTADEFWGIDSALLHYARLLGRHCSSWWGPTDPETRLRDLGIREEVHYQKIPCSPCIHVTEDPPCRGQNNCIHNLFVPKDEHTRP